MADKKIKIDLIDVPTGRLRDIDPGWAKTLAAMFEETGHKTPIDVEAIEDRFRLVAGGHRLEAAKILKWNDIACRVLAPSTDQPAEEMRLHEILENLGRKDFNALERCEAFSEMKRLYQAMYPDASKRGGKRGNQHTGGQKSQNEIFSFCQSAAESSGLSERSVQVGVAIFDALSPSTRERLKNTAFANKQSDLKSVAALSHKDQAKVLELVLGDEPKAPSIADAIAMLTGKPPQKDTEKLLKRVGDILPNLPRAARFTIFRNHKKDIIDLVTKEGWIDA